MSPHHLEWLRALPKGPTALAECPGVQFVHGAPEDEDRYVVTVEDSLETLGAAGAGITFFGHTHIQGIFYLRSGLVENRYPEYPTIGNKETWEFPLEPGASFMINPGSIGQPRDGDWRAAFALFDAERRVVTFYRVPYDLRTAQERIFAANLPPRLATRLAAGR